jgi:hypothetical protein
MRCFLALLIFLLLPFSASLAQTQMTPDQYVAHAIGATLSKCHKRGELAKKFEQEGKLAEAYSVAQAERMLCACIPSRLIAATDSLSANEKNTAISFDAFKTSYLNKVQDQCSAEMLRANYTGDCGARFASRKRNSEKYCSCMSKHAASVSDADASKIGAETTTYTSRVAAAKARGLPLPEPPALLKPYLAAEASCSTE